MQTKQCTKCEQIKDLSCYSLNKSKKSGYNSECKDCHKIIRKKYYETNKSKERERIQLRKEQQKLAFKVFKSTLKCKLCDESHIATLQFHHLDPTQKEIGIAIAVHSGWGQERLKAEIDKCVVLCANCHLKEHYELNITGNSLLV